MSAGLWKIFGWFATLRECALLSASDVFPLTAHVRNGVSPSPWTFVCECAVTRPEAPKLKLRTIEPVEAIRHDVADLACLGELCQAYTEATGWPLRYVPEPEPSEDFDLLWSAPVNPGVGEAPGHLRIDLGGCTSAEATARADWHASERMAGAVAELINELAVARRALWEREAELAAGVPVTAHEDETSHLAARLEAALRAGAQAIGCQSAAVYLLDESTRSLKLRAAWGMPIAKFTEPARPLANQLADLEALLGHAVVFEGRGDMQGTWRSPEPAAAAVCVPISSPTVPLGTLWFFSQRERPFSDEQTNIAEVVAGKIAADLDRAALLESQVAHQEVEQQLTAARRSQENQFPSPPPLEGWSLGGWTEQGGALGGAFYDWRMIDDESLMLMLGDACDSGLDAALASSALRAVLRADDDGAAPDLDHLLRRAHRVLRENSAGGWWAGAWLGRLDLAGGNCHFSHAGRPTALWLKRDGWASLVKPTEPLGLEPLAPIERKPIVLSPGDSLLVCNRGVMEASDHRGRPIEEAAIARALLENRAASPDRMIEQVRNWLRDHGHENKGRETPRRDRSILVVQRLPR